jgi:hypothetical protein
MFGFSYLKLIPIALVLGLGSYAAHTFIVKQKESRIEQLQFQVDSLRAHNTSLQIAVTENENTIRRLEQFSIEQNSQIFDLMRRNTDIAQERDRYLSIFRRHNLTHLARARPGMIETRVNNGTSEVFRAIEQFSKEIDNEDN